MYGYNQFDTTLANCKIIYKIEIGSSCKMNPIWYMVTEDLNRTHLKNVFLPAWMILD